MIGFDLERPAEADFTSKEPPSQPPSQRAVCGVDEGWVVCCASRREDKVGGGGGGGTSLEFLPGSGGGWTGLDG